MCYNANCDVVHAIPFRHNGCEYVVLITSVNTLTIWDVEEGECIVQYNAFPGVEYLLPRGHYDSACSRIVLYGGTYGEHNVVQFSISLSADDGVSDPMQRISIDGVYTESHYGLVRDVCVLLVMLSERTAVFINFTPAGRMPLSHSGKTTTSTCRSTNGVP